MSGKVFVQKRSTNRTDRPPAAGDPAKGLQRAARFKAELRGRVADWLAIDPPDDTAVMAALSDTLIEVGVFLSGPSKTADTLRLMADHVDACRIQASFTAPRRSRYRSN